MRNYSRLASALPHFSGGRSERDLGSQGTLSQQLADA